MGITRFLDFYEACHGVLAGGKSVPLGSFLDDADDLFLCHGVSSSVDGGGFDFPLLPGQAFDRLIAALPDECVAAVGLAVPLSGYLPVVLLQHLALVALKGIAHPALQSGHVLRSLRCVQGQYTVIYTPAGENQT